MGTGQYTVLIDIQAGIVIKSYIYSPLYIYTDIKYIRLYIDISRRIGRFE